MVIRIGKSKDTIKWTKKTQNNDLQNTTQKTNNQAPWTPQKLGLSSDALKGKKSLKIPKELSESVNRRTDNTMEKKTQNNDLQNTTQKTNDQAPWTPTKTGVELRCSWRGKKSLKIPKELSESVNRRTDNTMDTTKSTKRSTKLTHKLNMEQLELH